MKTYSLLLFAGLVVLSSCKPKEYEVSRELTIDAPASVLFAQVNSMKAQEAWSPWEAKDPNMTREYSGPESGVGAKYSWTGNDSVGTGYMEHTELSEPNMIASKLVFTAPWESESTIVWNFEEGEEGTVARWTVKGSLPGYLFWMGAEDMDEAMGPDFEKGLANLKEVAEAIPAEPSFDVELTEVSARNYYGITNEVSFSEIKSEFFGERFSKISTYLGSDMTLVTAPPFSITEKWDEEAQMAKITVAMASDSKKPGTKEIVKAISYAGPALKITYVGPYEGMSPAYEYIFETATNKGYTVAGSPWEAYVTDPGSEPDSSKWVTEIYLPVSIAAVQ